MTLSTTLKDLTLDEAEAAIAEAGAAYVDLRKPRAYLDVHIPGSLALVFEFGPGMAGRARDCVPLSVPLVLLEDAGADVEHAAASLRGKGFSVIGKLRDGVEGWGRSHGHPASTPVVTSVGPETVVLDVADPGARAPDGATRVPTERLWDEAASFKERELLIAAGYGIRAALAVGILERHGVKPAGVLNERG